MNLSNKKSMVSCILDEISITYMCMIVFTVPGAITCLFHDMCVGCQVKGMAEVTSWQKRMGKSDFYLHSTAVN